MIEVPVWEKVLLTIDEASAYSGIGSVTLRGLVAEEEYPFAIRVGRKRMIKRQLFEAWINEQTYVKTRDSQ